MARRRGCVVGKGEGERERVWLTGPEFSVILCRHGQRLPLLQRTTTLNLYSAGCVYTHKCIDIYKCIHIHIHIVYTHIQRLGAACLCCSEPQLLTLNLYSAGCVTYTQICIDIYKYIHTHTRVHMCITHSTYTIHIYRD